MPNIGSHISDHQKINLDQKIRDIAKDEAKKIPRSSGGGGGIEDAPKDSKQYARKDNNWVEVVSAQEETDPVWTADKPNYSTKSEADERYLQPSTAATRTIILSCAGGVPVSSASAEQAILNSATYSEAIVACKFDPSSVENWDWTVLMPDSYSGGVINATFYWTHGTASTNFGVRWGLKAVAFGDNVTLDAEFGTAQEVTDTGGTAGRLYVSPTTPDITIAGTPAGSKLVQFRAYRNASNAADTLAVDASLIMVKIEYPINAYSD